MKRLARKGAGYAMLTAGTVMIFTPGPGLVAIAGGLALLSEDVEWARRMADWLKQKTSRPSTNDAQDGG
jgi:ketosteroid isomerase-like protein